MNLNRTVLNNSWNQQIDGIADLGIQQQFTATKDLQFKGRPVQFTAESVRIQNYHRLMEALQLDPDQPIPEQVIEDIKAMKANETQRQHQQREIQPPQHLHLTLTVLQRVLLLKSQVEKFIRNSIFSAYMITNLVNDLLDLGKLENNAFQLAVNEFNLVQVVEEVFSIVSFQAETSGIKLKLYLDSEKTHLLQRLIGDKRRLTQILLNFISNSLKFTPSGGHIAIHLQVLEEQTVDQCQSF